MPTDSDGVDAVESNVVVGGVGLCGRVGCSAPGAPGTVGGLGGFSVSTVTVSSVAVGGVGRWTPLSSLMISEGISVASTNGQSSPKQRH